MTTPFIVELCVFMPLLFVYPAVWIINLLPQNWLRKLSGKLTGNTSDSVDLGAASMWMGQE